MDRNEILLSGINPATSRILEIGPSFSPVAAKRNGWRTTVVDHTDRDGLVQKYGQNPELDMSAVEEVDVIWASGLLEAAIPKNYHGRYEALIASHVIEHIVDPISFLRSADRLLAPAGRVLLAVPDLRLCFDCMRPTSTTGQVIAAWRESRPRHAWSAVFDAHAYDARPRDGSPSWSRATSFRPRITGELIAIGRNLEGYQDKGDGEYLDVHGWTFTPSSFALMILELEALGLSRWRITRLEERDAVEFLAVLERSKTEPPKGEALALQRCDLLVRRWQELREQADWMLGNREGAKPALVEATIPPSHLHDEIERLSSETDLWESIAHSLGASGPARQ